MKDYQASTYGDRWADIYDSWAEERFSEDVTEAAVSLLHDLAANRRALELGIGTGRVALPLAQRGVDVHGFGESSTGHGTRADPRTPQARSSSCILPL